MRTSMRATTSLVGVAVCLCAFVPPAVAQECPELVGYLDTPVDTSWSHLAAEEGYVYKALCSRFHTEEGEFTVIDAHTPSDPVEVGSLEICARAVVVSGDVAYVDRYYTDPYEGYMGVQVIDVSDPASPSEGHLIMDRGGVAAVSDGYLYTVDPQTGIWVIDVSDPRSPSEVGFLAPPGYRQLLGLELAGHYVYTTSTTPKGLFVSPRQFLDVIDVSDPSTPFIVGSAQVAEEYTPDFSPWKSESSRSDVAVSGVYAFVSTYIGFNQPNTMWGPYESHGGITVVDVRDPSEPVVAAYLDFEEGGPSWLVDSGHLLFTDWGVFDISHPSEPRFVSGSSYGWSICSCGRNVYSEGHFFDPATGSWHSGLQVFDTWTWACRHPWTQQMPLAAE